MQWPALLAAAVIAVVVGVLPFARAGSDDPGGRVAATTDTAGGRSAPTGGSEPADIATTDSETRAATSASAPVQAGDSGSARSAPTPQPAATGSVSPVAGPGITDDTITIGLGWFDINAYTAVLSPGEEQADGTTRDAADAVVRWLNDHGGIAGRMIEPVYHEYPIEDVLGSASTRNTREQAMCSEFTEDHRAFAAIPWISSMGVFYDCAAQHDLVTIATSFSEGLVDREMYERIGHVFYMPRGLLLDRREQMFVDQLDRRGFFPPDAKVGVMLRDLPSTRRAAENALFPALAARGVDVVETGYYSEIYTNWTNIVLRFRGAGVTHVVWGSSSSSFIVSSQFMIASEDQQYRPFNALGSDHGIPAHTLVTPPAQRERIVAVSWSPLDEGDDAYEVAQSINDADARCRQIKKDSGSDLAQTVFVPYCEGLFFIKQVLEAAPSLTHEGFRSVVEAPGFAHPVIGTWSSSWPDRRHDAASAVRDILYLPDCECFRFSGPTHGIG